MRIAILGGSFNPPHLGHILIAQQTLNLLNFDQVWLTPCYHHTFDKHLASLKDRVAMTKMLVHHRIKFSDEEIINKLSGHTIYLMNILSKKYSQHKFSFIMGSDNLAGFKKWGQWEKLITTYDFIIFPRPGFTFDLATYDLNQSEYKFHHLDDPLTVRTDISSTKIRERIKKGISVKNLVPKKVEKYIVKEKLYQI